MLRWGKGSAALTCTGASGAPKTPSSNLRSDRLHADPETEGALIQWAHLPSILESPPSVPSGSGPSFNGDKAASPGLRLPDLIINGSGWATRLWWLLRPLLRLITLDIGEVLLAGLLGLDLPGDNPLTTSSFNAEKKPCFLSILRLRDLRETQRVSEWRRANERTLPFRESKWYFSWMVIMMNNWELCFAGWGCDCGTNKTDEWTSSSFLFICADKN